MARISTARENKRSALSGVPDLTGQKGTENKQNQPFPLILTQGGADGKRQVGRFPVMGQTHGLIALNEVNLNGIWRF